MASGLTTTTGQGSTAVRFTEMMEDVALGFEVVGVAIILLGGAYGLLRAVWRRADGRSLFVEARTAFGQPLLLGLEVLVAADIIETVTVDRTLETVASLALLVLVRVVLSFSLDVEIDGAFPWRRGSHPADT
jgi:uncharacterized membrane protein